MLHVWRVPRRRLPAVLVRMAVDRRRLRALPGVEFAKLLGTAQGFGPGRPDLTRWAALVVWRAGTNAGGFAQTAVARGWNRLATANCELLLRTLASRGTWSGQSPFRLGTASDPAGSEADGQATVGPDVDGLQIDEPQVDGTVLALTRARLRPAQAREFWRASAEPAAALASAVGLVGAFGIGEAPFGWPGTVSIWRTRHDLLEFAYHTEAHRGVIAAARRWYAEELFARFAIESVTGDPALIGAGSP
jgi:hypothetical protein